MVATGTDYSLELRICPGSFGDRLRVERDARVRAPYERHGGRDDRKAVRMGEVACVTTGAGRLVV